MIIMHINDEMREEIKRAVKWAHDHPLTETELVESNYGADHNGDKQPNFIELGVLSIINTVEERDGEWYKHLCFTLKQGGIFSFLRGKTIPPCQALQFAQELYEFRVDGPFKIFVEHAPWDKSILLTHLYELV